MLGGPAARRSGYVILVLGPPSLSQQLMLSFRSSLLYLQVTTLLIQWSLVKFIT